jgi:hypothetical protein
MRRRRRHGPCDRELGTFLPPWKRLLGRGGGAGSGGSLMRSGGSGGVRGVYRLIEGSQVAVKRSRRLNGGRPPFDDGE